MIFERTVAVIDKTIKDLAQISYWITFAVQIIFLGLYGYKIYMNLDVVIYLVIYCFLAVVSIFGFLYYILTYKQKSAKKIIGTKRGVRISKYLANATMIVVILIQYAQYGATDLETILSSVSIISFIFQILFEFLRIAYDKYSELISTAINMDVANYDYVLTKLTDPKGTFFSMIDAPLEKISNKISGVKKEKKPLTKTELYVEELTATYKAQRKEIKAKRIEQGKSNLREHFKIIMNSFKRKNDVKRLPAPKEAERKRIK